jgi:hypothetical protein
MFGPSLNGLMGDKHNNLFQAAHKLCGYVRNQALLQQMTSNGGPPINNGGPVYNIMSSSSKPSP